MPIPTHVLADLAARYGYVDPADRQAVAREMLERQNEPDPAWDPILGLPDD